MNTETNTTHTDNGGKFYVVNAEGRLIGSSNKKRTKRDKAPKQPKKQPSQEQLTHLEEAVWEDSKFRIKFLKFIQGWEQKNDTDEELDEFLDKLPTMKERALFHCWTVLEWRPRADKKKVVFAKKNPYTTKKQRSQTA